MTKAGATGLARQIGREPCIHQVFTQIESRSAPMQKLSLPHSVGTGKDLLAYMLMKAPSLHIKNVVGVIFAHNHASLHLFAKFGFVEWGRLPEVCDMGNMLADVVILGKRIKA